MVIPNPWVWRHNGTVQCQEWPGQSLEEAREQLAALIGEENVLEAEERELPCIIPKMCGIPTGKVNACLITVQGYLILMNGFVGPMGWRPWTDECPEDWAQAPYAALAATGASRADGGGQPRALATRGGGGSDPTAIAELFGRRCRCYTQGDALTQDYLPERVNIGLNQRGRIVEIWFG